MTVGASTVLARTGTVTDATSFNTASIAPTAGRLCLVVVMSEEAAGATTTPTVTGASTTWTQVASQDVNATGNRVTVFRGIAAGTGALTIDFAAETQTCVQWAVYEFSGVDTAQGDQGVIQAVAAAGNSTTGSATLAAFGSATNATVGVGDVRASSATASIEGGYTQLDAGRISGAITFFLAEFLASEDTSPSMANSTTVNWAFIGIELAEAVAGGGPSLIRVGPPSWRGMNRGLNRGAA